MAAVQRPTRRPRQFNGQRHQVIDAPIIPIVLAKMLEPIHDPNHAAVRGLRKPSISHCRDLSLDERRHDPERLKHPLERFREPLRQRGRWCERHQHRQQHPLVDQQHHLRPPKPHVRIPVAENRRRLRHRRQHRPVHPVKKLPRRMNSEHTASLAPKQTKNQRTTPIALQPQSRGNTTRASSHTNLPPRRARQSNILPDMERGSCDLGPLLAGRFGCPVEAGAVCRWTALGRAL